MPDGAGGVHAADASREHLGPVEEQDNRQASASGSRSKDKYSVGDLVYFHRPANVGGVAVLAALQQGWFAGVIETVTVDAAGFTLYV